MALLVLAIQLKSLWYPAAWIWHRNMALVVLAIRLKSFWDPAGWGGAAGQSKVPTLREIQEQEERERIQVRILRLASANAIPLLWMTILGGLHQQYLATPSTRMTCIQQGGKRYIMTSAHLLWHLGRPCGATRDAFKAL